jgi:hypothetical protein
MTITIEHLGYGISRIGKRNVGYADVAAVYTKDGDNWTVEVQATNVVDSNDLERMVAEFRKAEGLD